MPLTPSPAPITPPSPPQAPSWPSSSPRERFLALVDQAALELEAEMRAPSLYQQGREDERRRLDTLLAARIDGLGRITNRRGPDFHEYAVLQSVRSMLTPQT